MFHFLNCFGPLDCDRASLKNIPQFEDVFWNMGDIIRKELPDPIEIDVNTDEGEAMVTMFHSGILIMTKGMVETLNNAGVNNLQVYNVVLYDRSKNISYNDYLAVNIVGKIACADMDKSNTTIHGEPIIDVDFDGIVIDESKIFGMLMFRIAECVSGIVVHDKVKTVLEKEGIKYLDFILPEDWVG